MTMTGATLEEVVNGKNSGRHVIRCAAVLFDMDGTLVDSSNCVESTWRMWAGKHGVDIDALLRISHGRQNYETIRLVAPHLETPEEIDFLGTHRRELSRGHWRSARRARAARFDGDDRTLGRRDVSVADARRDAAASGRPADSGCADHVG